MRRLDQHEHHIVRLFLLGLRFDVSLTPGIHLLTAQQVGLESDEVLARQEAISLIVVQLLELVEDFLQLAAVRLKLTTVARSTLVRALQLVYLILELLQLSSFMFVEAVLRLGRQVSALLLLLTYLLFYLSTSVFTRKLLGLSGNPLHVVLLVPLDQIYAFEDVSDIVDTALLHSERDLSRIQVKALLMLRA